MRKKDQTAEAPPRTTKNNRRTAFTTSQLSRMQQTEYTEVSTRMASERAQRLHGQLWSFIFLVLLQLARPFFSRRGPSLFCLSFRVGGVCWFDETGQGGRNLVVVSENVEDRRTVGYCKEPPSNRDERKKKWEAKRKLGEPIILWSR